MKIGIIDDTTCAGLGGHGVQLAFRGLPGVEAAALADANPDGRDARMAMVGAGRVYALWREMIDVERPDIVVIASRLPGLHGEMIRAAVAGGCHVFCEKPFTPTLREADEICRLAKARNVRIAVAYPGRHALVFRTMKRLIEEGAIGRVLTWYGRGKEDERGGGEDLLVLGTHILDLAAFLFGPPEAVFAEMRQDGRPVTCADRLPTREELGPVAGTDLLAMFRFANNVQGIFESRRGVFRDQVRMGMTVAGTAVSLSVRFDSERNLRISRSPYPAEDEAAYEIVPLAEERVISGAEPPDYDLLKCEAARYFIDNQRFAAWDLIRAVGENREPAASAENARLTLEMVTGIYQSHLEGRRIDFPLVNRDFPLAE